MPQFNSTRIKVLLLLGFIVLATFLLFLLNLRKNHTEQQHLQLITERYRLAYKTIYNQHKKLANNIYSGVIDRYDVVGIYQKLQTAGDKDKNRLRDNLYASMRPRYEKLHTVSKVRQIHFHLQNNESFLRMHRPEVFGDDLTDIRETVNYVNTVHLPIDGFEEGRIYNGYRFVFPLTVPDKTHLGSMEVAFGPESLTSAMMNQYAVLSNFMVKEETVKRKVLLNEQSLNYRKSHHKGYLYDKNVIAAISAATHQEMEDLKPSLKVTDQMYVNAHSGHPMSLYDSSTKMVFTTIPILNPVTQEMVAFLTVRSRSTVFMTEMLHYRFIFVVSLLLLGMCLFTFYMQYSKRMFLQQEIEDRTHEIKEQQEQLQAITQNVPGVIFQFYANFTGEAGVRYTSPKLLDIFGLEFIADPPRLLELFVQNIHSDDRKSWLASIQSVVEKQIPWQWQGRYVKPSGEIIWFEGKSSPTVHATGIIFDGILIDITEKVGQEAELLEAHLQKEQLNKLKSLKTMAGAIAHRFNNAMMAIQGYLELMTYSLSADSKEYKMASNALQAATGASQIGSMMLSYVGQQFLELEKVPLETLVSESITSLKHLMLPAITLDFIPPEQPLYCSIDQKQMKDVIISVMTNAIEALPDGGGTVEITFGVDDFTVDSFPVTFHQDDLKDGRYVFCQIKDSGHGISPEDVLRVFEPFYTTRFVGRGLGLALTVGLMQLHQGAITIESRLGVGTTVRVLLPASLPVQSSDDKSSRPSVSSGNLT